MLCLFKVGSGASLRTRDSRRFRFSIFDSKNDKNVFILHRWTMMTNIPSSSCIRISSSDDEKHNDENDIEAQEHHVETGSFPPMNRGIPIGGGCPVFHNNARSSSPLSSSTIQDMQDTLNNSIQEMHHMDLLDAYDDDDDDDDDHKNNKKQDLDQADDVEQPQRQLKSAIRKKSRFSQLSDDVSMDFVCSNDKKREDEKDLQEEFDANRNKNKELSRQRRSSMTLNESIDSIRWKEHGLMEEIKEEDDSPSVVPQRPANYRDFLKAQRSMRLSNSQNLNFQEGEDASYTADESSQQTPEQQNPEDARRLFQSMRVLAPKMTEAKDKAAVENMIYSLEKRIKKLDVDGTFKDKNTLQAPWYSVPIQRQRWGDDQVIPESNFSNLFFDLFFIGAIYNIQGMLLTAQAGDWLRAIFYFIGIFGPIFVTWETDVYYHSRYCVVDYAHRFFDVVRFVFVTATVLFIQPLPELKNPQSSVAAFALTMSIFLESILHLLLNVELYHKARGDRVAIQNHTLRKIQGQLMPKSIIYFLATLSAGIFYFVPMDNVPLQGAVWSLTDLPLTLTGLGYVGNITFTLLRKLRAASANSDIRKTFVPNNIDYVIQRYNDWFLLLLGEAVMAMVEITDSERDYFVASMGALTTIVIHTLKFESEPGQAHGHALWRNMSNATCFSFLTQVLSTGLILFGVSYKILLTDDRIGLSGFFCTLYVCLSLAWVLITLELMVMTHKGLTKTWQRLFHEDEDGLQVLYWPLVLLTLFKLTLFSFLMTIPVWTDNVNIALIWSFIVVFLVAITRIVGWAFVFREDEIKEFVSKAKKRLRSKVSFVSDSDNLDRRNSRSILSGRTSSEMKMTASSRIVGGVLRRLSRKVVSRKSSFISSAGSDYDIESSYRDSSFSSRESFNSTRKRAEVYDGKSTTPMDCMTAAHPHHSLSHFLLSYTRNVRRRSLDRFERIYHHCERNGPQCV